MAYVPMKTGLLVALVGYGVVGLFLFAFPSCAARGWNLLSIDSTL
jgi:hypothetical protein